MLKSNISWCFDSADTAGLHQAKKLMIVLYASPSKQGAGFEQLWFVHFDPFCFRELLCLWSAFLQFSWEIIIFWQMQAAKNFQWLMHSQHLSWILSSNSSWEQENAERIHIGIYGDFPFIWGGFLNASMVSVGRL